MVRVAPVPPEEGAILCEACGYILQGLPADSCCPECASPMRDSAPQRRGLPAWESADPGHSPFHRFWHTTAAVLFRPAHFYRTLATRVPRPASRRFARIHLAIASLLLGLAAYFQGRWILELPGWSGLPAWADETAQPHLMSLLYGFFLLGIPICTALAYAAITLAMRLGARLTAWEAAYRGLRLPLPAVTRGLDYHCAHLLPVALVGFATVAGYQALLHLGILTHVAGPTYLYLLSAEVVGGAAYLFWTYWIGMRNVMYANA